MARDLNLCVFIGRAGSDSEITNTQNGNKVAKVSIAVGDSYNDKSGAKVEKTLWLRLEAWGNLADIFANYVKKGKQIQVTGQLKIDKYPDKDTGKDMYSTSLNVQSMQLLGGGDGNDNAGGQSQAPQQAAQQSTVAAPNAAGGEFDDDIPFAPFMHGQLV